MQFRAACIDTNNNIWHWRSGAGPVAHDILFIDEVLACAASSAGGLVARPGERSTAEVLGLTPLRPASGQSMIR
jgi:hypothetical protein